MKTYSHRGHQIEPKRDFGSGYLIKGKMVKKGWVVTKCCGVNAMPGATWFQSVREAREAIDVLIKVKGDAQKFWEIMQPFQYKRVGQKADFQTGEIRQGRFKAIIENFRVVKLFTNCRNAN